MSLNLRDMQAKVPPELPSGSQKPSLWRAALKLCLAIDTVYFAAIAVLCVSAIAFAVVTFDAETLVLAMVGILVVFVIGCLMLGLRGIDSNR